MVPHNKGKLLSSRNPQYVLTICTILNFKSSSVQLAQPKTNCKWRRPPFSIRFVTILNESISHFPRFHHAEIAICCQHRKLTHLRSATYFQLWPQLRLTHRYPKMLAFWAFNKQKNSHWFYDEIKTNFWSCETLFLLFVLTLFAFWKQINASP